MLSIRSYDTGSGRLLQSDTYQVGSGGIQGKAGTTAGAAVTEAATAVGKAAAEAIAAQLGSGGA